MTKTKNCLFCSKEFEGSHAQKYCCDLCKELSGVEKRTGIRISQDEAICFGNCCKVAKKAIRKRPRGWLYLGKGKREFGVYVGEVIKYCPWCGGKLA